MPFIESNFKRV